MKNFFIPIRNFCLKFLYKKCFKNILFRIEPEVVHDHVIKLGTLLGKFHTTRTMTRLFFSYAHPILEQNILGIHFANPVGLAAGFDKDAVLTRILPEVGFGFAEVGSITGEPCSGNQKPRLWRLKESNALLVYYGLKNMGCEAISKRLRHEKFHIPVGISIAKTNSVDTVEVAAGINDYVKALQQFIDIGSYYTVNISCPNAFGGEPFTSPERLEKLLAAVDAILTQKPIFLKLSPDLTEQAVENLLGVCQKHRVHGFICSNLTKNRDNPKIFDKDIPSVGGISGKVVEELANKQIEYIYRRTRGQYVLIGCGGVFSAEDAYKKILCGASLIQLITGMIFEGPQLISEINRGLVKLLQRDGFLSIDEARGKEYHNETKERKEDEDNRSFRS